MGSWESGKNVEILNVDWRGDGGSSVCSVAHLGHDRFSFIPCEERAGAGEGSHNGMSFTHLLVFALDLSILLSFLVDAGYQQR